MREEKVLEYLKSIKNPVTGGLMSVEKRITEVNTKGENIYITYDSTNMEVKHKRDIEDQIYNQLDGLIKEDNLYIMPVSKEKPIQAPAQEEEKRAGLSVGHGPSLPKKKEILNVKKVILVASGKGGVGKSTVATNLAIMLGKDKKVGLLDADIYGPSIPLLLGKGGEKPGANENKKIVPIDAHGIKFISFGLFIEDDSPVVWRGPMLGGVLNQFLFDVEWGELDYLILDTPPGTGDVHLSISQLVKVDGAVVVSTPQDVSLLDTKKGLNMFNKVGVPILGIVENMSSFICSSCSEEHFIFGNSGAKEMAENLKIDFFGTIPMDQELRELSDKGEPPMSNDKNKK